MRLRTRPNLLALLRTISKGDEFPLLSTFTDEQVRWIIQSGLAPLVCFASRKDCNRVTSNFWHELKAADLTSYLLKKIELEILDEILSNCRNLVPPLTLLKGCSIATELYPEPHFRLMRDIDVLVRPEQQPIFESILNELGFRQQSANALNII